MVEDRDTIYATSTAGVPAALAVIRVSGPQTRFVLETMAGGCPAPRHAALRPIGHPEIGEIDRGIVLWFPGPASFTGEDVAEFHVHGGRAVVAAMLDALGRIAGTRFAEPGEFTWRAFVNGRMELTAVEGLADLIAAETEAQRRQALRQGEGRLGTLYDGWRNRVVKARALIEAELDFADEDDVPDAVADRVWSDLAALLSEIRGHLARSGQGRAIRAGLSVVLQGPPNSGKSSLLNALSKRDAAIVSGEAGTTRDVVTVAMDLGGYLFSLSDTAGIREAASDVEAEGVRRARRAGEAADLVLWLCEPGGDEVPPADAAAGPPVWTVRTKCDLAEASGEAAGGANVYRVSAKTGEGIAGLESGLIGFARETCGSGLDDLATRARHVAELENAAAALDAALAATDMPIELRAEDLRRAADAIGRLTGRVDVEDLLDVIFSEFCIGK